MLQPPSSAVLLILLSISSAFAGATTRPSNVPAVVQSDPRVRIDFGEERLVLAKGLQPSMLCTKTGALIVQAQAPRKPLPSARITYPSAMDTVVSRDAGKTWTPFAFKAGENPPVLEGAIAQLGDGTILALDTYVSPGASPGQGS